MAELNPIIQLGNPILRHKSARVEQIQDQYIQQLIDDLISTVVTAKGVGIAAPQIGASYRLLVVASHPNTRYPFAPLMAPTAMINPQIISQTAEVVKGWEGCLSVPGIRGLVPRYQLVEVEYTDRYGHLQTQIFTDFVARILQHEYDHLDGIVFVDRLESTLDLMTELEYQNRIVNQS
jgi:peptide deformylase